MTADGPARQRNHGHPGNGDTAITPRRRGMGVAPRVEFFRRLAAANPHPTTELEYASPFQLLAAVMLSAQSTDRQVNICTRSLFAAAPAARDVHALGVQGIAWHIRSLGLYNAKANHLWEAAGLLLERHGGEVPADRKALEALPGVGRKTANVLLNTLFGWPVIAVDTHIFRVANRTGLGYGATVEAVEAALMRRVPADFRLNAHHWLILHGRYVCTARQPRCRECIVADLCRFPERLERQPEVMQRKLRTTPQ
jgi:endonuclease III